ncbi:MAG: hypothetical protein P4N59_16895 [Negativicutes bacterium]|nr:hypothetical protein [Negativicutes bacterium]
MYTRVTHECGGHAHLVGKPLVIGWNMYCCDRCAHVFQKWVTKEMLETKPRFGDYNFRKK